MLNFAPPSICPRGYICSRNVGSTEIHVDFFLPLYISETCIMIMFLWLCTYVYIFILCLPCWLEFAWWNISQNILRFLLWSQIILSKKQSIQIAFQKESWDSIKWKWLCEIFLFLFFRKWLKKNYYFILSMILWSCNGTWSHCDKVWP